MAKWDYPIENLTEDTDIYWEQLKPMRKTMAKWDYPRQNLTEDTNVYWEQFNVTVSELKEHKKMRMLSIRKLVKDHITGKEKGNVPYLAKLELDKEDNTRLVIALQDLVDDERARHTRARGHIVQLRGMVEQLKTGCIEISNAAYESSQRLKHTTQRILDQNDTIAKLQANVIDKDRQIQALIELLNDANNPPMQETASASVGEANVESGRPLHWSQQKDWLNAARKEYNVKERG